MYSREEVYNATLKYFKGDDLATNVWINKYALKDSEGSIFELTPDDMHRRIAKELARIEKRYPNSIPEDVIYRLLKDFKYIVPQGSPMAGIGNNLQVSCLSNCYVISDENIDSYGGIMRTDEEQVQLMKRRAGVGHDLSGIRPKGSPVKNSALTSTGVVPFMERYSNTTREAAQCIEENQRVLTERGLIAIKNVLTGDKVWTRKGWVLVNEVLENGKKSVYKVITKLGHSIKCTLDHIFLSSYNLESVERSLKEIGIGGVILLCPETLIEKKERLSPDYQKEKFIPDYIIDIFPLGELPTYDLKLDEEHLFFCEGFYVHNSGRRGALMLTISIDHPDSEDFIDAKLEKGKVTGANISVKITDAFMYAALKGEKYGLKFPVGSSTPKYTKEIDASKLWNKIIHNAWRSAEPGVLFWDTLIRESVPDCYADMGFKTISTNPCLTGDTYVALADGSSVTIKDLAENGEDVEVYTLDHRGYICKRYLRNPRITGYNEKIYKLVLEDGTELRTTGNHKFRLHNGQYKEVKEITNKDVLFTSPIIYNLGVKEVVEDGCEEVYNGTVDDYHNFFVSDKHGNHYLNNLQCGELPLCGYDSCRLLVLNLYSYVNYPFTPHAYFNYELFRQHVGYAQRFMDDIIDLEIEKIDQILEKIESDPESDDIKAVEKKLWLKIKDKCLKGRRTGLGITALGDMLAAMGFKYGSTAGNDFAEEIQEELAIGAYRESNFMAAERGTFPLYDGNLEKDNPFLKRINQIGYDRRNIALLTIAPTGSVSILTQTTSGIEPAFMISYKRRRKVNPGDKNVNITFVDEVGDSWEEYHVFHHKFITWLEINGYDVEEVMRYDDGGLQELIKKSPYYGATANDIDWVSKVQMQGRVQKYVDHSISVTVNVPRETTVDMVKSIYETAWRSGCKGCTIYRDGSRSGVLVSDTTPKVNKFGYLDAVKRPKELDAKLHVVTANGEKYGVLVGLLDDNPYEIFAFPAHNYTKADGKIIKVKKGEYQFKSEAFEINNLETAALYPEGQVLTRLVSGLLRHGTNPYFIIEQIDKTPLEIVSFGKVLSRVLKTYIKEDSLKGKLKCNDCSSTNVSLQEGCLMCNDCGSSKCG